MDIKNFLFNVGLDPSLWADDVPLFDWQRSLALIGYCKDEAVGILGIEGFEIKNGSLAPRMDWIADFSPDYTSKNFNEFVRVSGRHAISFLSLPGSDKVLFEFCLVDA